MTVRAVDLPERYRQQVAAKMASAAPQPRRKATRRAKVGDGASDGETSLRRQARMVGLPAPETQFMFAKSIGRNWRFDGCWPDLTGSWPTRSTVAPGQRGGT